MIYVLAEDKSEQTYDDILETLLKLEPKINPTDIMTDFELAAINAAKHIFPLASVHGCFFHFTQNLWRKIQTLGLQSEYNTNAEFAFNFRLIIALAFLPEDSVLEAYEELMGTDFFTDNEPAYKAKLEEFLTYFQATYLFSFDRLGQKKPPLFDISLWNVYSETLSGKEKNRFLKIITL